MRQHPLPLPPQRGVAAYHIWAGEATWRRGEGGVGGVACRCPLDYWMATYPPLRGERQLGGEEEEGYNPLHQTISKSINELKI